MSPLSATKYNATEIAFKGRIAIGKNWFFSTYGMGQMNLSEAYVELRLPWAQAKVAWDDITEYE